MTAVQKLIEEARALTPEERRELLSELEQLDAPAAEPSPPKVRRYARTLALAGTGRSDHTDVSADKYAHLADALLHDD